MDSNELIWNNNLEEVKLYINKNKCKPTFIINDNNIKKLCLWINNQMNYYKNNKYIMKKNHIKNKWEQFINEYKEYFSSYEEIWNNNLEEVKLFIDKNNCKPSKDKYLSQWIGMQLYNYKYNRKLMKNNNIRIKWEQFIEKYKKYFLSYEEIWNNNLEEVKLYIKKNKCKPSRYDKDDNSKKLFQWIVIQQHNYKNNIKTLKNNNLRIKWENFIKKNYKDNVND